MKKILPIIAFAAVLCQGMAQTADTATTKVTIEKQVYEPGKWYVGLGGFVGQRYVRDLTDDRFGSSWVVTGSIGYSFRPRLSVQSGLSYRNLTATSRSNDVAHWGIGIPLLLRWSPLNPRYRLQPYITFGGAYMRGRTSIGAVSESFYAVTCNYGLGLRGRIASRWWVNVEVLGGFAFQTSQRRFIPNPFGTFYNNVGVLYDLPTKR